MLNIKKLFSIHEDNKYYSYENFCLSYNILDKDILFIGDYFLDFFLGHPILLFEKDFDISKGLELSEPTKIKFSGYYIDAVNQTVIINPNSMPMLCKPNEWSDKNFGGYLNNKLIKNKKSIRIEFFGYYPCGCIC